MVAYGELMDLNCFLKFILMMIVPILVLLVWAENNLSKEEELVETNNEIDQLFEQELEQTRPFYACSFCGKLSDMTTKCSRCKAALYCSKVCNVMHWRFWHKDECVESEGAEDQEGSPSHRTHFLLMEPENETDVGEIPYTQPIEAVEPTDGTAKSQLAIVNGYGGCAVCGNPSRKKCSRCKAIKYWFSCGSFFSSKTCQHWDWRLGHNLHCAVEKEKSTQPITVHHEITAQGNVVMPTNSYAVEDNVNSYGPLCLEFYSEGNANTKALILSSQVATTDSQKEIQEQVRSLKQELEMIKNKNVSLQSEHDKWKKQSRYAVDRLYSIRKEYEHQLFVLKHKNELISNAEKQARKMLHSLSQRLHRLQIELEAGVIERKKQEEYIHSLQNECVKAKTELQEQKKCVQRLTVELDEATHFPMRIAPETRQKLANALSAVSAAESKAPATVEVFHTISLSRNPTYTRQGCAVCLTNEKDMAFDCGHMTCRDCGSKIRKCHICRKKITNRIRLFPG